MALWLYMYSLAEPNACVSYPREVSSMEKDLRAHVLVSQGWYTANTILSAREVRLAFALNDFRKRKGRGTGKTRVAKC